MTEKGIIVACPQKYEHLLLNNITFLRNNNCNLPIEIWEIGKEISDNIRLTLNLFDNISFQNVLNYSNNPNHWKGFQIKTFMLYHNKFKHVLLMDADTSFYKNPEFIFNNQNYINTGTYFFHDLPFWTFNLKNAIDDKNFIPPNKFFSLDFFNKRKTFIKSLLPSKPHNFPSLWNYIYDSNPPLNPVNEALQDSGVVFINRDLHKNSIEFIHYLNTYHKITYQFVAGDKETFWLGILMANNNYYFHPQFPQQVKRKITHFYNNEPFWKQK